MSFVKLITVICCLIFGSISFGSSSVVTYQGQFSGSLGSEEFSSNNVILIMTEVSNGYIWHIAPVSRISKTSLVPRVCFLVAGEGRAVGSIHLLDIAIPKSMNKDSCRAPLAFTEITGQGTYRKDENDNIIFEVIFKHDFDESVSETQTHFVFKQSADAKNMYIEGNIYRISDSGTSTDAWSGNLTLFDHTSSFTGLSDFYNSFK